MNMSIILMVHLSGIIHVNILNKKDQSNKEKFFNDEGKWRLGIKI